jgi:thymidylate synthase
MRIFGDNLQLNVHLRSNDAFKAAFMNMFAFTELQKMVAEKISQKIGKKIKIGKYVHIADSYHIYGSYYQDFQGFLDTLKKRSFEERTWSTSFAKPFFEEGRKRLEREKKQGKR